MLGKLIRYDSKIQLKFLSGIFVVAALISVFTGIINGLRDAFPKVVVLDFVRTMALVFCILAIVVMVVGTVICVVMHFRKNIFKDEGYLMHTLPVTGTQLFISKLITGTICIYGSIAAAYLCVCIGTLRWDYVSTFVEIMEESGVQGTQMFVMVIVMVFLSIPLSLCQFYAALTVGYTWKINSGTHVSRDLLSVVAYIILYFIQQILGLISLFGYVVISYGNPFRPDFFDRWESIMESGTGEAVVSYVQGILGVSFGMTLILGVVLVMVILRRLNHHLNLE